MNALSPRMVAALATLKTHWLSWPWELHNVHISTLQALERRGLATGRYDLDAPEGSMHTIFWKKEQT